MTTRGYRVVSKCGYEYADLYKTERGAITSLAKTYIVKEEGGWKKLSYEERKADFYERNILIPLVDAGSEE